MAFHRLTVPSYFGGLPGGYDYINNAASGVPANTDGALSFGPNIGSYFVGFGEDALSSAANRGLKALAQNTDAIDDSLRRDIAVVADSGLITSTGDKNYTLPIGTYLGASGTLNTAAGVAPYLQLVDNNGNVPVDASNAPITITGFGLSPPDTIGNGFTVNLSLAIFSSTIPSGVQYRVYYGVRSNLANLPASVLMRAQLISTPHVDGYLENVLSTLHGPAPGASAWDSTWTSSIYYLATSGIDERYRHASGHAGSGPPFWPFAENVLDTAGAGAWFHRDGPGITGFSEQNFSVVSPSPLNSNGWMSGAVFAAIVRDISVPPTSIGSTNRVGGETTGFFFLGGRRFVAAHAENTADLVPGFASIFHGYPVEVGGGSSATFSTWLPPGTTITFDGTGFGGSVSGPAFFGLAGTPITTAIAIGYDLLELDFGDGLLRHFVMTDLQTATKASFSNPDGSDAHFTNGGTATIRRWIRVGMAMFDDAPLYRWGTLGNPGNVRHGGFLVTDPPPMTSAAIINAALRPSASIFSTNVSNTTKALAWGGYDPAVLTYAPHGALLADGSISGDGSLTMGGGGTFTGAGSFGGNLHSGGAFDVTGNADVGNILTAFGASVRTGTKTSFVASISSQYNGVVSSITHDITGNGSTLDVVAPTGTGTFALTLQNLPASTLLPSYDVTEIRIHFQRTSGALTTLSIAATDTLSNPVTVVWESGTLDATFTPGGGSDLYIGRLIRNKLYMSVQRL